MNTTTRTPAQSNRLSRLLLAFGSSVVLLLLVAYLAISVIAANVLTQPRRVFDASLTPARYDVAYQDVRFPAADGRAEIAGWYLPASGSQRAVILTHGKDGSRTGEFQGRFSEFAAALQRRGFAVLMIDLRGHGQSGNGRLGFGLTERHDIAGAVVWLQDQGFAAGNVGVLGVSMGAASAIGATADTPAIGAVVADCSFAEVASLVEREWRGASGLPNAFLPSSLLMARMLFGTDFAQARPIDEIDSIAPRPLLIIHGDADAFTPVSHGRDLHAAAPGSQLWVVPGAGHGRSYATQPEAYVERVATFFDQHLGP